jgi:hypothetical protein
MTDIWIPWAFRASSSTLGNAELLQVVSTIWVDSITPFLSTYQKAAQHRL